MKLAMLSALGLCAVSACGGGVPAVGPGRESGQSGLMDKTFAGANKCNAKSHTRPFIIEWDATDMSQFEALTASDVVFVKYTGCELSIVDSCKNDSVKGMLGSYKAIDWTSGSVEKVEIKNEAELFAKLPLGAASLGARVNGGESFRMEYFVSGTRSATRPAAYQADLAKLPGCKGVTHFVYAYNVGAFALGSDKNITGEAGVTVWGAGAGGNSKYASAIEKKGGLLASCRGESAKEIDTCKTPIRLTLREIEEGENPDAKAAIAPETPDAKNLAGKVDAERKLEGKAKELMTSATEKLNARDGKGCLSNLDAYDRIVASSEQSANPRSYFAINRARCLMMGGQCDAGKLLLRKWAEGQQTSFRGPEQVDGYVSALVGQYCQGNMSPRDQVLRAKADLNRTGAADLAVCKEAYETLRRHRTTLKVDKDDPASLAPETYASAAVRCFAKAKDCQAAWNASRDLDKERAEANSRPYSIGSTASNVTGEGCHAKDVAQLSPLERITFASYDLERMGSTKVESSACRDSYDSGASALQALKSDKEPETVGAVAGFRQRATSCFIKAGDCKSAWSANKPSADGEPEKVESVARRWGNIHGNQCRVKDLSDLSVAEKVAVATRDLSSRDKKDVAECKASLDIGRAAALSVTPAPETDALIRGLQLSGAGCLARAGDCAGSRKVFIELGKKQTFATKGSGDAEERIAKQFESNRELRECTPK